MVTLLTYRRTSEVCPVIRVKQKRYKKKTALNSFARSEAVYEGGEAVSSENVRKLRENNLRVAYGQVVEKSIRNGYAVSLKPNIQRAKLKSRSASDVEVDDVGNLLKKALMHKGYQVNDILYQKCKDKAQTIEVDTTISWEEDGVKFRIFVGNVRIKKVFRTECQGHRGLYNYGILFNGDDVRKVKEQIRLARMTAGIDEVK